MIGIKEFLLHKALNKKYYNLSYKSWKDIDNILLLFESDYPEKNSQIKNFIKQVKEDNKNIVSCCFVNKKKSDSGSQQYFQQRRSCKGWCFCRYFQK